MLRDVPEYTTSHDAENLDPLRRASKRFGLQPSQ